MMKLFNILAIISHLMICTRCQSTRDLSFVFPSKSSEVSGVTLNSRNIPPWVSGQYVLQTCGGFGDVHLPVSSPPRRIEHLFDCMGQVSSFQFDQENNRTAFSNKLYRTKQYKIWEASGFDMAQSGIAWQTVMQPYDYTRYTNWSSFLPDFYEGNPNVDFWRIPSEDGNHKFQAVSYFPPVGYSFDPETLDMFGQFPFDDNFISTYEASATSFLIPVTTHAEYDLEDGQPWSVLGLFEVTEQNTGFGKAYYLLYKVEGGKRVVKSRYEIGTVKLNLCAASGSTVYPDSNVMIGHMGSFTQTENYIVLITSSYGANYCRLALPRDPTTSQGEFADMFPWVSEKPGKILVYDKRTSNFITKDMTLESSFIATHSINAFEQDDVIHLDMITYNYPLYSALNMNNIINDNVRIPSRVERLSIDSSSWTVQGRMSLSSGDHSSLEFPQISNKHKGLNYRYSYLVSNPYSMDTSFIVKLNVDNHQSSTWFPPSGEMVGQPQFLVRPRSLAEDDGLLLVPTTATRANQGGYHGHLHILDAQTMREVAVLEAPVQMAVGLYHGQFYPSSGLTLTTNTSLLLLCVLLTISFL